MNASQSLPDPTSLTRASARAIGVPRGPKPRTMVAIVLALFVVLVAFVGPVLAPYGIDEQSVNAFEPPGPAHWLGTDELGRDLLSRIVAGLQLDLLLALVAIPIGGIVGVILGLSGIWFEALGQFFARIFDVIIGFPSLVLGIAVALIFDVGTFSVGVAIAIACVPVFGRLARAGMLGQLGRDYVVAAVALGASRTRVLFKQVLPNIAHTLVVQGAIAVADAVFIEGGMSILGLGVQPPTPSLGSLMQTGLLYIYTMPIYVLAPTLLLAATILAFSLLADRSNSEIA